MSELEPYVRMSLSNIQNALIYGERLEGDYAHALEKFRHHAEEAAHQLRLWADANGIEIREGMLT